MYIKYRGKLYRELDSAQSAVAEVANFGRDLKDFAVKVQEVSRRDLQSAKNLFEDEIEDYLTALNRLKDKVSREFNSEILHLARTVRKGPKIARSKHRS